MGLEDRAREHIAARAARDAKAARHESTIVEWRIRQVERVQQILSEFIKFAQDYGVAPVTLFYVVAVTKKPLFGKKAQLEFDFEPTAQVWKIGKAPEPFEILTVTEDLKVFSALRIQKSSGEHVLAIDNGCARTFPPYSVSQLFGGIQSEDFQPTGPDSFTVNPIALATKAIDPFMMEAGIFPEESPWIEDVIERAAVAIIDRNWVGLFWSDLGVTC